MPLGLWYNGRMRMLKNPSLEEWSFPARKNLDPAAIADLIGSSKVRAVRMITDYRNGDKWYWPAELATHAYGARYLGVPYDPIGGGLVLVLD